MYLSFVPSLCRVSNGFGRTLVAVTVIEGGFEGRYFALEGGGHLGKTAKFHLNNVNGLQDCPLKQW
jgi:hypothetical protein